MNKASHTPIPWDFVEGKFMLHIEARHDNRARTGIPVCSLPKSKKANAAHICHCVNLHDELVEVLDFVRKYEDMQKHKGRGGFPSQLSNTIRAVLAKAQS